MSELAALIDRLEKATGPDRELDKGIHREISKRLVADETVVAYIGPGGTTRTLTYCYPYWWGLWGCPHYTRSVEPALDLIPDGLSVIDLTLSWDTQKPRGWPAVTVRWFEPGETDPKNWRACVVGAPTKALAICCAAMKIRAASIEPQV